LILNISHLVVNGCSYTYGHGISDPVQNAWPSLVAKKLGVPLINLGLPGQSNHAIKRRTLRYFFKDLYNHNNPFYIHAYTQSQRREIYLSTDYNGEPYQDYKLLDAGDVNKLTALAKENILHTDEYYLKLLEVEKYNIWNSINSLLDKYNINHFCTDYMPQTDSTVIDWINKYHYILKSEVETELYKLKNFNEVTEDLPKTSCLHETEEGHKRVADYVYNQITKRYSDINVINKPYTKLKDCYIESPAMANLRKTKLNLNPQHYYSRDWGGNVYFLEEIGIDWRSIGDWMGQPGAKARAT